ncbi:unnamed protein product [Caenorhabditis auriculariae]|uniref:Uncharacterized protein n=1 Tax=Caenorhabditis auriculariae TaxID=2777116 RepID=A0A8S1H0C1_9PELO|nr:unnamed protein product [Caenorhabditis auriculariae]
MAGKQPYTTLVDLETQLSDHKAKFEQWKSDNSRQKGTKSYSDYVASVASWEQGVKDKIAALRAEQSTVSGPKNVDLVLEELLEDATVNEFAYALIKVYANDKDFMTSFISAYDKIQRSVAEQQPALVVPAAQFYPGPTFGSNFSYTTPQLPQVAPGISTWSLPLTTVSTPPNKYHKPLSPIRDFQKKSSTVPFRDFGA